MNELEEILGIQFPEGTIISGVTNSTKKIKKDYIFFGLPGTKKHGSKYIDKAIELGASIIVHNDPKYHSKEENIFFIQDLYEFHPIINPIFDLYDENTGSKHFRFLEKFYDIYNINQIGSDIKFHGSVISGTCQTKNRFGGCKPYLNFKTFMCHQALCLMCADQKFQNNFLICFYN